MFDSLATMSETTATTATAVNASRMLITLKGAADLARVQRSVVSMWRSRFAMSVRPFPAPVVESGRSGLFDAAEVADWLVETGHGNNAEARMDAAASATITEVDLADPTAVAELSALIALHALRGGSLARLSQLELRAAAELVDPSDAFLRREIEAHAQRAQRWCQFVDQLVDATFTPGAASDHVLDRHLRLTSPRNGSLGPLDNDVETLVIALAREFAGGGESAVLHLATSSAAELVHATAVAALGADDELELTLVDSTPDAESVRAARRRLSTFGIYPEDRHHAAERRAVHIGRLPAATSAGGVDEASISAQLARLDDVVLGLGAGDSAIVVAPARTMIDGGLDAVDENARASILRSGMVRALVRLPAGSVRSAPREALALLVLGTAAGQGPGSAAHEQLPPAERFAVVADLTDVEFTPATRADLVSDLVAAMGDARAVRSHAFRFAHFVRTSALIASRHSLVAVATGDRRTAAGVTAGAKELPALIDQALAALGDDAPALQFVGADVAVGTTASVLSARAAAPTTVAELIAERHLRAIPGVRIDQRHESATGLALIGLEELEMPERIGARRIELLLLAEEYPRAQLTQPGDVVVTSSPVARSWLDAEGGNLVTYPARVLRITAGDPGGLVSAVLATDSAHGPAGPGAWRRARIRRVAPAQTKPLHDALAQFATVKAALQRKLDDLDDLEHLVIRGVASAAVVLEAPPTLVPDSAAPAASTR